MSSTSITRPTRTPKQRQPRLTDLPLVAYALRCGHTGRQYGIQKRDLIFCTPCASQEPVSRIIAT